MDQPTILGCFKISDIKYIWDNITEMKFPKPFDKYQEGEVVEDVTFIKDDQIVSVDQASRVGQGLFVSIGTHSAKQWSNIQLHMIPFPEIQFQLMKVNVCWFCTSGKKNQSNILDLLKVSKYKVDYGCPRIMKTFCQIFDNIVALLSGRKIHIYLIQGPKGRLPEV